MQNIKLEGKILRCDAHFHDVFFLQEVVSFYTWDYKYDLKAFQTHFPPVMSMLLYITHLTILQIEIYFFTPQGNAEASRFSTREAQHNCDSLTPRAEFEPHC